jgi:hypothetical protein
MLIVEIFKFIYTFRQNTTNKYTIYSFCALRHVSARFMTFIKVVAEFTCFHFKFYVECDIKNIIFFLVFSVRIYK